MIREAHAASQQCHSHLCHPNPPGSLLWSYSLIMPRDIPRSWSWLVSPVQWKPFVWQPSSEPVIRRDVWDNYGTKLNWCSLSKPCRSFPSFLWPCLTLRFITPLTPSSHTPPDSTWELAGEMAGDNHHYCSIKTQNQAVWRGGSFP